MRDRPIHRWPVAIGALSLGGLIAALLGDGMLDALSWLLLAPPAVLSALGLYRALRPAGRPPR